eukprot:UN00058
MPLSSGTQQTHMSATTTTASIQSVNNHTEFNDPTLAGTDWKAYKDAKGANFYVNNKTMESTWKHPITGEGEDDKGW